MAAHGAQQEYERRMAQWRQDGEELVAEMNRRGMIDNIPVVIVSSAGSEPRVARLKENGVRDYIQKPFTPEHIREVVDNVMGVQQDA